MQNHMRAFISKHFNTNRSPVSGASNDLVNEVIEILGGDIIDACVGEELLTWIVPKHWEVREAYIATLSGDKIVDFADNPLHLWQHSVSVDTVMRVDELLPHLLFNEKQADKIPFHYRNQYKYDVTTEWGFSLSYNQYKSMTDDKYRVYIDAELSDDGIISVGDCFIQGESDDTILFSAHSCHPAMAADGLSDIAVLVELFTILKTRKNRYSYRFVVGPEYYAAAVYLTKANPADIAKIKYGMYLDFLGAGTPFAYQSSFQGDSRLDQIMDNYFKFHLPESKKHRYRHIGNDEMFYNGPGFYIPMPGFNCEMYDEYHTDADNLELLDYAQLEESVQILLKIISIFEDDYVPVLKYMGPLYQYRHKIEVDAKLAPELYAAVEHMQILADGQISCFDIARRLDVDFFFVRDFFDKLYDKELIEKTIIGLDEFIVGIETNI